MVISLPSASPRPIQDISTDLAPKGCFISAQPVERVVGQIGWLLTSSTVASLTWNACSTRFASTMGAHLLDRSVDAARGLTITAARS
jgi:hypothetical protein